MALIFSALIAMTVFDGPLRSLLASTSAVHYVYEDKIFDENGSETKWRGTGTSYLLHAGENYQEAWQKHFLEIQAMDLNTIRLAFAFADSSPNPDCGTPSADIMDFDKLDWVLRFLGQHGVKAILDLHNWIDMEGDFGSQKVIDDWVKVAARYRGESRIVAYELFNEPAWSTYDKTWMANKTDAIRAYAQLTDAIRQVDPEHIVIWTSSNFLPAEFPEGFEEYVRQNVVYSVHRWYHDYSTSDKLEFELWTPEQLSYMSVGYLVEMRERLNAPFWLGEFGSHYPMNESNPEYLLTEQILFRCEEQAIGWSLWLGHGRARDYLPFFPLKIYNQNFVRKTWSYLAPKLTNFVIDQQGLDRFEPYRIEMWGRNDYVTFKGGISILVITTRENPNGIFDVLSKEEYVTGMLKIRNEEEYTEDRNVRIYPLAYLS